MDFSSIFETIKGFFEANVLPTLKPIIDAIMGLIGGIIGGVVGARAYYVLRHHRRQIIKPLDKRCNFGYTA